MRAVSQTFTRKILQPAFPDGLAQKTAGGFVANLNLALGTILAQITAANVNDVQTLTGSDTSGTFTLTYNGQTTTALNYNATAAQVQAALLALSNMASSGVACTGGALGSAGIVITFGGAHGNQPQNLITVNRGTLAGGSTTMAHTTTGVANGKLTAYNGAKVVDPTTAPTLTAGGSDGTFGAGSYEVAYTLVTAAGESLPSYGAMVTLTSAQHIAVTSITGLDNAVTAVNMYVNGMFVKQQAVTANATGAFNLLTAGAAVRASAPPAVSTAFVNSDGSQVPIPAILQTAMASDGQGRIVLGASAANGDEHGAFLPSAPYYYSGAFNCADLVGLDTYAAGQIGRLLIGTTSAGVFLLR